MFQSSPGGEAGRYVPAPGTTLSTTRPTSPGGEAGRYVIGVTPGQPLRRFQPRPAVKLGRYRFPTPAELTRSLISPGSSWRYRRHQLRPRMGSFNSPGGEAGATKTPAARP